MTGQYVKLFRLDWLTMHMVLIYNS